LKDDVLELLPNKLVKLQNIIPRLN